MLITRILSALAMLPIVGWAVYWGGGLYLALACLAMLLCGHEFYRMMARRFGGFYPLGMGGILALMLEAHYAGGQWVEALLTALVVIGLTWALFRGGKGDLSAWAVTMAGVLYIGILGRHLVLLRELSQGMKWVALGALPTWTCDTAAYLVGTARGRHPFLPKISPKKTWEGAIGGWVAGAVVTVTIGYLCGVSIPHGVALGVLLVLGATAGDLAESMLKRQAGVKDSGSLIPGHGGLLDRVDSLLFTVPIVYHYLTKAVGVI